jgi:hypothetical protein
MPGLVNLNVLAVFQAAAFSIGLDSRGLVDRCAAG